MHVGNVTVESCTDDGSTSAGSSGGSSSGSTSTTGVDWYGTCIALCPAGVGDPNGGWGNDNGQSCIVPNSQPYNQRPSCQIAGTSSSGGSGGTNAKVIKNVRSGKCMQAMGTGVGSEVQQWSCNGATSQRWEMTDLGNGYRRIKHPQSGLCLDGMENWNGSRIVLYTCDGGQSGQWQVQDLGNAQYKLTQRMSGLSADIKGGGSNDGAKMQQYGWHGGDNQWWRLETP